MENDESLNIQNKTNINCCGFNKDPHKHFNSRNILNSDTCNFSDVFFFNNCFQLLKIILLSIDTFFLLFNSYFQKFKEQTNQIPGVLEYLIIVTT